MTDINSAASLTKMGLLFLEYLLKSGQKNIGTHQLINNSPTHKLKNSNPKITQAGQGT